MPRSNDKRYWSAEVTRNSHAMDLEAGVFTWGPRKMAESIKRSAEHSSHLKSTPFRSAMSMLTFYENRAGKALPPSRRRALQQAKDELRKLYGKPPRGSRRRGRVTRRSGSAGRT
ncbi:MAG TPA: DUF3175 domain-containing protein [Myxococcales bacterium]|nr:DUF3175 domain-containing protein [Myxococcales bacterium]